MKLRFKLPFLLCLLLFSFLGWHRISGVGKTAFAFEIDADKVLWSRLSYRAKSIFGKVETDVHLMAIPLEAGTDVLMTVPEGEALQPSGATIITLTVYSKINPLIGTNEILKTQSWFDPNEAGALQRVRQRLGKKKWQKSYRYTDKGVFRLKKMPKDSREANLPLANWTQDRESFYPYDAASPGCSAVLEPSGLLMIASVIKQWKQDAPLHLFVFNKKQLHQVKVSVDGLRRLKVNYIEKSGTHQTRRDTVIDAVKISFEPRSLAQSNEEPEEFSFLGLKGDFDILLDPNSYLPVQVSGKIATFGQIDIRLQEVELKTGNR